MSKEESVKQIERAIKSLVNQIEPDNKKIAELSVKIVDNVNAIASLAAAYESITGKQPPNLPDDIRQSIFSHIHPSAKIGDAINSILSGTPDPLTKNEIIDRLRAANIRISLKSPRNVLNTAIKTDKQKRFVVLDDGRVSLRKENAK